MSAKGTTARCRVVAFPASFAPDEYAEAATEIEERLTSLPGTVAVYKTGGVSAPGISDIDRIAVLERPAPIDTVWAGLAERTRAIAMHGPFAVDRETFERHRWFAHLKPLELVAGVPVGTQEPPHPRYFSTLLGVEGLVIGLLKLLKQWSAGSLKARPLLCELHALRHSLQLAELAPEIAPGAWRLVEVVDQIRETWFQQRTPDQEASVRTIVGRAPAPLLEALGGLQPTDGAHDFPEPLPMSAPWDNVTIVPADARANPASAFRIPRTAGLMSRSRRLPELRWRLRRRRLAIPPVAFAWLHGPGDPEIASLRAERDRIVLRYAAFVDACGGGWSSIGFARSFLTR